MNVMVPKVAWNIDTSKTALIVIDMQRGFLDKGAPRECASGRDMVPKINELADVCRKLKIPVIFVCHLNRADLSDVGIRQEIRPLKLDNELEVLIGRKGGEIFPDINIAPQDYVVPKIRHSAFIAGSSSLEPLLRGLGLDRFMICGVATDVCVGTTTMDAMMLDFRVFVIADLVATFNEQRQRMFLELLDGFFAKVTTFREIRERLDQLMSL